MLVPAPAIGIGCGPFAGVTASYDEVDADEILEVDFVGILEVADRSDRDDGDQRPGRLKAPSGAAALEASVNADFEIEFLTCIYGH